MITPSTPFVRIGLLSVLMVVLACGPSDPVMPLGANLQLSTTGGVKFLTQTSEQATHMEALFTGGLTVDDNGCIRLDSPDDATVIWPRGYSLHLAGGVHLVRDGAGRAVGLLDGDFSLGGGEVARLHSGMGFTQADESFVAHHCPGRYWIASGR